MALYPCDLHGARYAGKQTTVYLAVGTDGDMDRVRLRTCAPCFEDLTTDAVAVLGKVIEDDRPMGELQPSLECSRCNAITETVPIFLTCYPAGRGQDQWYGRMCPSCAAEWRATLMGDKPPTLLESRRKGR